MKYKIYNQDVMEWAKEYQKGKFHALISDTPYHLQSIVKRFGKKGSAPAKHGTDGVYSRSSKGFMGQTWDGGDIAFRPETWEALGEHLYPGAFGMCFSASRNWHRLAVAIEDAGFIIHPTIFGWLQSQGFPKATNLEKQMDDDWAIKNFGGWCECDDDCNTP
jgi:site-specific DNA-methyltransferase (adenine-specific)